MVAGELVGREREISALVELLGDDTVRVVTVTGPAGVGKTRVAYAVAELLERDASLACVRVELGPLGAADLVGDAIAAAAGADELMWGGSAVEAAAVALAEARVLLVLDNFEHVAAAAGDVAALVAACPGVTVLATSRQALGLTTERLFPLSPLALPEPDECDAAGAGRRASVALFVTRVRAREPGFVLTDEIAPAVAEICRRLDGLPLAIELVAARAAAVSAPALLARWDAATELDLEGAHDVPARQQTLRRALDWSYDLLGPQEQALLRRLAAFPGGFGLAAVDAACRGDGETLPALDLHPLATLALLVDRNLVERGSGPASESRYTQLATVRGYLRGHLERRGEAEAALRLMTGVVGGLAPGLGDFGLTREDLDGVERELNNVHAALDLLVQTDPAAAVELAADLFGFWRTRRVREGLEWLERALAAAGAGLPPAQRSRGTWAAAMLGILRDDTAAIVRHSAAALAAARETGDRVLLGRALFGTALAAQTTAGPEESRRRLRESLALAEETADLPTMAGSCNVLGEMARRARDLDDAEVYFRRAHALWREVDDDSGVAMNAHNLAYVMTERGEPDAARDFLLEALALSSGNGNRVLRAYVLAAVTAIAARSTPVSNVARLYGATESELGATNATLDELEAEAFREAASALRSALGAKEFAAAAGRGRTLDDEQQQRLVERLLAPATDSETGPLTKRELEVVRLMAAGLTNGEIAARLVLSEHTVHRHVSNILRKLDARSRAAAASRAAQTGLL